MALCGLKIGLPTLSPHTRRYLGGWPNHPRHLPPSRNSCVVDVTCELPRTHTHKYLAVQVWDTCAPTLQQLQGAVDFARGEEQAGRSVYIHCAHGHGRSATVMCACLIECGHARSVEEAVAAMKSVRPLVHLSPSQRQVRQWEGRGEESGKESVMAVPALKLLWPLMHLSTSQLVDVESHKNYLSLHSCFTSTASYHQVLPTFPPVVCRPSAGAGRVDAAAGVARVQGQQRPS